MDAQDLRHLASLTSGKIHELLEFWQENTNAPIRGGIDGLTDHEYNQAVAWASKIGDDLRNLARLADALAGLPFQAPEVVAQALFPNETLDVVPDPIVQRQDEGEVEFNERKARAEAERRRGRISELESKDPLSKARAVWSA